MNMGSEMMEVEQKYNAMQKSNLFEHQMAQKKTSPRPPAGDHGNGRDPLKTIGKQRVAA